jgi:hypothetical protein
MLMPTSTGTPESPARRTKPSAALLLFPSHLSTTAGGVLQYNKYPKIEEPNRVRRFSDNILEQLKIRLCCSK